MIKSECVCPQYNFFRINMLFLLAFKICLHKCFFSIPALLWVFVGRVTRDMIFAIFHFVISYYYMVAQSVTWIKLSCHQKCIHSLNKFLKIMKWLLSNEEVLHSQGSVQILKAKVVLRVGNSVSGAQLNNTKKVTSST